VCGDFQENDVIERKGDFGRLVVKFIRKTGFLSVGFSNLSFR
jgi:hypothetical protein